MFKTLAQIRSRQSKLTIKSLIGSISLYSIIEHNLVSLFFRYGDLLALAEDFDAPVPSRVLRAVPSRKAAAAASQWKPSVPRPTSRASPEYISDDSSEVSATRSADSHRRKARVRTCHYSKHAAPVSSMSIPVRVSFAFDVIILRG